MTDISSISMSSALDAKAMSRASTSSQPCMGSQGQRRFLSVEERVPTGSVSIMTLLFAIAESCTKYDHQYRKNWVEGCIYQFYLFGCRALAEASLTRVHIASVLRRSSHTRVIFFGYRFYQFYRSFIILGIDLSFCAFGLRNV